MKRKTIIKPIILAALVAISLNLAACFPFLLAGAGAGGYYVGQDDRSVGTITDDATITGRIKTKFIADDYIRAFDINVDTYSGVVSLYGNVRTRDIARRAVEIAEGVQGVRRVESKLTIVE